MAIIKNIDQLRKTIKINVNTPWDTLDIFLNDAQDKYLLYYLGMDLVNKLENVDEESTNTADKPYLDILQIARRCLGPFAEALGTNERSINTGDSGHTVIRTDKLAPASDYKIQSSMESLLQRAWQNMENLLDYLHEHEATYPEWKLSRYYINSQSHFFFSAKDFQDFGMIYINQSRLTFEKLRQLIIRIELSQVQPLITDDVYNNIFEEIPGDEKNEKLRKQMLLCIRAFIGARVGELHTSQTTRTQRAQDSRSIVEYKAVIRPLYDDISYTGNYYTDQAAYWESKIIELLPDFGVDTSKGKMDWNNHCRKIFNAEG